MSFAFIPELYRKKYRSQVYIYRRYFRSRTNLNVSPACTPPLKGGFASKQTSVSARAEGSLARAVSALRGGCSTPRLAFTARGGPSFPAGDSRSRRRKIPVRSVHPQSAFKGAASRTVSCPSFATGQRRSCQESHSGSRGAAANSLSRSLLGIYRCLP